MLTKLLVLPDVRSGLLRLRTWEHYQDRAISRRGETNLTNT